MPRKHNNKGRRRGSEPFVMLPRHLLASEAYRSLSPYGRTLLVEILRRYNGVNNGQVAMGIRDAAEQCNCSDKPIRRAFKELQHTGFITVATKGSFDWKQSHATEWTLTMHSIGDEPPTKDYMRWEPEKADKRKTQCAQGTRTVYRRTTA